MSIQRPTATVTVDGQAYSMAEGAVAALRLELAFAVHDRAVLGLWSGSDLATVSPGAELSIALGFGDDQEDVFTGVVEAVDYLARGIAIEALSSTCELSRVRVAQAYVSQSVADIVRDLISQGGGQAGDIDASGQLAVYHVDERRTVWAHLVELARLAVCDLSSDADGAVSFRPPRQGGADKHLRYGAELVAWRAGPRRSLPDPVTVVPYGAASEAGSDGWHLVLRTPDGASPSGPSLVLPAVRDRDLAQAINDARSRARDRAAVAAEVVINGDATLRPGAVIALDDLPSGDPGELRVLGVTHQFDGARGFLTTLRAEAAA